MHSLTTASTTSFFNCARECDGQFTAFASWKIEAEAMLSGMVLFFFLLSGEVQTCTELTDHVSRKQGRDLTTEGL